MSDQELPYSTTLKRLSVCMVGLLSLQFLLGISTALNTAFPSPSDLGVRWGIDWASVFLVAHVVCGSLLVVVGFVLLLIVWREQSRRWRKQQLIGLASLVVAAMSGGLLVSTGSGAFALLMAAGFLVAMVVYVQFMGEAILTRTK